MTTGLAFLGCSYNQIDRLDLSMNSSLATLNIEQMPSLTEVCVWTTPFPPDGFVLRDAGSPNVFFTTECSQ
jgi:hypothetical protein